MKNRRPFEYQLMRLSLISSVPLLLTLIGVMLYAGISIWLITFVTLLGGFMVFFAAYHIRSRTIYRFRSLNNLLDAMIQGEYSLRVVSDGKAGAFNELAISINSLAARLSEQRWEADENLLLVETIIEHIDVAILALTDENEIGFLNPAAQKLFQLGGTDSQAALLEQLTFIKPLSSGYHQVVELSLGHHYGSFSVHVEEFRKEGRQHKLLFISDVTTLLRREERKAWQNLVRVISHEINNSLSPIVSISQTLKRLVVRQESEEDFSHDLKKGLNIIAERATSLGQFVDSYKKLTKLPEPQKQTVSIATLIEKIRILFSTQKIIVLPSPDIRLTIDPIQFEQVLINLVKNGVEAMAHSNPEGAIRIEWQVERSLLLLKISDQGKGISNLRNLFVPFYSTKKDGSGIGLVLCRQIIEAHDGRIYIVNNSDGEGCQATIEVPLSRSSGLFEENKRLDLP